MSNFFFVEDKGAGSRRRWSRVAGGVLGLCLLLQTPALRNGPVATPSTAAEVPSVSCAIPVQPLAPAIDALSKDIARRFHVGNGVAIGITHAAFAAGRLRGVDPMLVLAVAAVESKFKSRAVNPVTGAKGLMQVMPQWHQDKIVPVGGDPSLLLIEPNIRVGTDILADYLDAEDGNLENALGRYLGTAGGVSYTKRVHVEMRHLSRVVAAT